MTGLQPAHIVDHKTRFAGVHRVTSAPAGHREQERHWHEYELVLELQTEQPLGVAGLDAITSTVDSWVVNHLQGSDLTVLQFQTVPSMLAAYICDWASQALAECVEGDTVQVVSAQLTVDRWHRFRFYPA